MTAAIHFRSNLLQGKKKNKLKMWRKGGNTKVGAVLMSVQRRWKTTHSNSSATDASPTSSTGASSLTLPPIISTKLLDAGYRFQVPWAVQWGDMDVFGHVNNCEYFKYFQHVRVDYLIALNISCDPPTAAPKNPTPSTEKPSSPPSSTICVNPHIKPIIAHIDCKFKIPIEFPDKLALGARVISIHQSASKFVLEHAVYSMSRNAIAATGQAVIVVYDYEAQKRAPFPDEWITSIKRVDNPTLS